MDFLFKILVAQLWKPLEITSWVVNLRQHLHRGRQPHSFARSALCFKKTHQSKSSTNILLWIHFSHSNKTISFSLQRYWLLYSVATGVLTLPKTWKVPKYVVLPSYNTFGVLSISKEKSQMKCLNMTVKMIFSLKQEIMFNTAKDSVAYPDPAMCLNLCVGELCFLSQFSIGDWSLNLCVVSKRSALSMFNLRSYRLYPLCNSIIPKIKTSSIIALRNPLETFSRSLSFPFGILP